MKKEFQATFSVRQYMLSKDFEIYYYNDCHLSKVEKHVHNYYEFYFFLEGDVSMMIDGRLYPLTAGDIILIPPNVYHHAVIHSQKQPYRRFVFWMSQEYCCQLMKLSSDYVYLMQHVEVTSNYIFHNDFITFNMISSKVFLLIEEIHSDRFGKKEKISLCVSDLILHLNRTVYEQLHLKGEKDLQNICQSLLAYIEEHLDETLTLDKLAEEFYVSKYYIAHIFKETIGLSIHRYITKKRLDVCRNAILGNESIGAVYLKFGFKDYSSFYRAFKKEYGLSPKEYKDIFAIKEHRKP